MKLRTKLAGAALALMALSGAALAEGSEAKVNHHAGGDGMGNTDMMQMMKRMHSGMMEGGGMAHMGGADGMMGGGLMSMMKSLDTDGDGSVTPVEAREGLQALLAEYDADGNQTLSIAEFETMHSALVRETMVDRFQFLDDDGDGKVTMDEIVKPAAIMGRMQMMRDQMMQGGGMGPGSGMGQQGKSGQGMKNNN